MFNPKELVGQQINVVRNLFSYELEELGWEGCSVIALEFGNGTVIFASSDEEMNGPGELFYWDADDIHLLYLKTHASATVSAS